MSFAAFQFCYLNQSLKERFHSIFPDTSFRQRELLQKFMHDHPPGEWKHEIQGVLLKWERDVANCILLAIEPAQPAH